MNDSPPRRLGRDSAAYGVCRAVDLQAFSPRFLWPLFGIGPVAGTFEQIGRTGFARPHLLQRWRLFVAELSFGLVWALWPVLVNIRQNHGVVAAARVAWPAQSAVPYLLT